MKSLLQQFVVVVQSAILGAKSFAVFSSAAAAAAITRNEIGAANMTPTIENNVI